MEWESVYMMTENGEPIPTNFDDYIPQLFIKNICKGRLIGPELKAKYLQSSIDDIDNNDYMPPTPKPIKRIVKGKRQRIQEISHTGEKLYKCNFCPYEDASKYKTRMHRKVHAGEDFACHLCTFKTINKQELQQHVKKHIGDHVYKCAYCSFQTLYKTGLKTHLLRHTGVKPFKCTFCDYRAFQKIHVERHAATHANGKQNYKCRLCDFKSAFKIRLERHLFTHEEIRSQYAQDELDSFKLNPEFEPLAESSIDTQLEAPDDSKLEPLVGKLETLDSQLKPLLQLEPLEEQLELDAKLPLDHAELLPEVGLEDDPVEVSEDENDLDDTLIQNVLKNHLPHLHDNLEADDLLKEERNNPPTDEPSKEAILDEEAMQMCQLCNYTAPENLLLLHVETHKQDEL